MLSETWGRPLAVTVFLAAAIACSKDDTPRVEPIVGIEHAARVAFDPQDEKHFLVVERAGAIVVFKFTEGENIRVLTIRTDAIDAVFHGGSIVSVHRDGSLRRWRLDGTLRGKEARPEQPSRATAIESLGNRIVTADESGRIHVWNKDLEDAPVDAHPGGVIAIAADERRGVVVSVGKDKKVFQWHAGGDGPLSAPRALSFDGEPMAVAIASDGVLAIGGWSTSGGAIDLVDLLHDTRLRRIQVSEPEGRAIQVTPVKRPTPVTRVTRVTAMTPLKPLLPIPSTPVTSVSFSRLTGALAANGRSGPITINRDGSIRMRWAGNGAEVDIVKFSARGELLAAISTIDGSIALHAFAYEQGAPERTIATKSVPRDQLVQGGRRARGISLVRPFNDGFVAATVGGILTFSGLHGTTNQFSLPDVARFVALGVSDAKELVAVASGDGRGWVCRAGSSPALLPDTDIQDLAVSRTGLVAIQHFNDSMVRFISADGSGPVPNAIRGRFLVRDMAFIKDDALGLLGPEGIELVSISGQQRTTIPLPGNSDFNVLATSPDGSRFAAGAADGTIALFDSSFQPIKTLRPRNLSGGVTDLAFSGREHVLASAHELDKVIRLWNAEDGAPRLQSDLANAPLGVYNYGVSIAFARSTDILIALQAAGKATIYNLTVTPLSISSLQAQQSNVATVSPDGEDIATAPGDQGVFWWKPDGGVTRVEADVDHFQRITDIVFSQQGGTLFARPERSKPVVAWNGKKWQIGGHFAESQLGTRTDEAIYVANSHLYRWRPGHAPVAGARVNASDVGIAPIAATEDVALAWNIGARESTIAVASRNAVTWQKKMPISIVAIAAPALNRESIFATSSTDASITLWRKSPSGWSAAYTVPTSDATFARALAFDSHGQLFVGTAGGTLESRDVQSGKITFDPVHLGNSISRVGITTNRVWASLGNGQILFLSRGLDIKATMTPYNNQAIIATPSGRYSGTIARAHFFRGVSSEPLADQEATPMSSPAAVTVAITGNGETWANLRAFFLARIKETKGAIGRMSWWQRLLATPPFLYGVICVFLALTWLIAPNRLAEWAMQRRDERDPPPFTVFTKSLLLVHWLGHTTRAVDAWIDRSHDALLSKCFTSLDNVKKRSQYVDLGNAHEINAWREAIERRQEIGMWIAGTSGCGKSTLAFALARQAIAGIRRQPLPVVVDTDWEGELTDFVRRQLSIGERWMTKNMLSGLARRGRIILVIDGLSERRMADAKSQIIRTWTSGILRYLIVASRDDAPEEAHMRDVRVGPLTAELLPAFAREYIAEEKVKSAVEQVEKLANKQGIRPLFAKLAIDLIAAGKTLPTNYPKLVHEYVVALRPRDPQSLALEDFLRAARICAFSVVDERLAPTLVADNYIRARLNDESFLTDERPPHAVSSADCINQLVKCGLLDQVEAYGALSLRFSFDLIAEYLAAMEIVHRPVLERNAKLREKIMAELSSPLCEALDRVLETKLAA